MSNSELVRIHARDKRILDRLKGNKEKYPDLLHEAIKLLFFKRLNTAYMENMNHMAGGTDNVNS